jgi:hypothetical protein
MKRFIIAGALVSAVATLIALSVVPATSQVPAQRTTIELWDPNPTDFEKNVNEGGKGFSAGDWSVFKDTNFDPETCEPVATLLGRFQLVKSIGQEDGFATFDVELMLEDGKIFVTGGGRFSEFEAPEGAKFAIVGGTGAYKDATGEATLIEDQEMCEQKGASITLDLLLEH